MRKMQSDTDNVDALPSGIQVTPTLLNSDATISCPLEPGGGEKKMGASLFAIEAC